MIQWIIPLINFFQTHWFIRHWDTSVCCLESQNNSFGCGFWNYFHLYLKCTTFTSCYRTFSHSAVDPLHFFCFPLPESCWIMNNLIWQTLIKVDVQQTLQNNVVIKPTLRMLWYSVQEFAAVKSHLLIFNKIFPLVLRFDLKSK